MGNKPHAAEDAAQTVLMACYRHWRKIGRLADRPDAYAFRALRRELGRSRDAKEVSVDPHAMPELSGRPSRGEDSLPSEGAPVRAALMTLPMHQREVVVYAFYLDLPDGEIARVLDIPIGTIKSRKSRALHALEQLLESANT
ncbi:MAG: sigma factor-like helix-turn-helix DNA-binding protein [Nocardioides sp.]|uniref:sigma factor-like helix-turn-helix DNA-binding protein n=1 Tax=Nocardioides sp. TaxID=35761 RepID=UPI0039E61CBE